jgi:hypothetical protein
MIIKKINGVSYILKDQRIIEEFGKIYKDSFWIECDEKGNVKDVNGDGEISYKNILCNIPEGASDIDLDSLKESCLYKNNNGQLRYKE